MTYIMKVFLKYHQSLPSIGFLLNLLPDVQRQLSDSQFQGVTLWFCS